MDAVGRRARLESLYRAHAGSVSRYARRRADDEVAADVVSEVFVVAWRRLDDVPEDALPWLLGCARRVLWHQHRAEQRRLGLLERLAGSRPPESVMLELPETSVGLALRALSERDREALLLTAWEGLSAAQAAAALGCSTQAFRVRAHRARERLAAAMSRIDQQTHGLVSMQEEVCE